MSKRVLIKIFGRQMNGYGSDKIADVLHAAQGDESTDKVDNIDEAASLTGITFTTSPPGL
ncbi:MAG: hypothetical protein GZ093_02605 [Rhodoferax sp.]|uniref:hypothetical protein n=1 Tax=Rhodoferax sp. TaxID=50421 RepID=UPI0013FF6F1F|nr:hypothetical protein [Rhodoferax sp.]NDP37633.1 hypothetical protein [Rhodoferax sp.]